jgi:carbon storage regulator
VLVLTRKTGQRIQIGDHILLTVVRAQNGRVRIGIDAPRGCRVLRGELTSTGDEAARSGVAEESQPEPCLA